MKTIQDELAERMIKAKYAIFIPLPRKVKFYKKFGKPKIITTFDE